MVANQSKVVSLELATRSVKAAKLELDHFSSEYRVLEKASHREWKILADRELERVILNELQEGSTYPILSEEVGSVSGIGSRCWIVDPLDGSVNYSRGIPYFGISVGLWENNRPILGVVLDIPNNRLYSGIVGTGAWCNGVPLRIDVDKSPDPSKAVFCSGLPSGFEYSEDNLRVFIAACKKYGKVRMLGSAALMLCYVAAGICDSYWEKQIALWDVGAGLAIIEAAGGVTRIGNLGKDFRLDVEAAICEHLLVSKVYAD